MFYRLLISSVFLLCLGSSAQAESVFSFALHNQATVLEEEVTKGDYTIALGIHRKSNNRWFLENKQRVQGEINRITLELPRDFQEQEVFEFYQQQVPQSVKLVFSCELRRCGESNNWANDYFGVKQLYGANGSQYLAIYHLMGTAEVADQYFTIYTVRRGNRRLYTQLETVVVNP